MASDCSDSNDDDLLTSLAEPANRLQPETMTMQIDSTCESLTSDIENDELLLDSLVVGQCFPDNPSGLSLRSRSLENVPVSLEGHSSTAFEPEQNFDLDLNLDVSIPVAAATEKAEESEDDFFGLFDQPEDVPVSLEGHSSTAFEPVQNFDLDFNLDVSEKAEESEDDFFGLVDQPEDVVVPNNIPLGKRRPGRPVGSKGGKILREANKRVMEDIKANELSLLPEPGSIEHARMHRNLKKQKTDSEATHIDKGVLCIAFRDQSQSSNPTGLVMTKDVELLSSKSPSWNVMLQIGSGASRIVALAAHDAIKKLEEKEGGTNDFYKCLDAETELSVSLIFEPNRHHYSDSHLASMTGQSRKHVRAALNNAGVAALLCAGSLWGTLFHSICQKVSAGEWEPILFVKKTRYDETPSKLRLDSEGGSKTAGTQEQAKFAKAFQFELSFHVLVRDRMSDNFLHMCGFVPCDLTVVDRTTAECTKAVILKHLNSIPELARTANMFPTKFQLTTVDRYSANYKAEKSLQCDDPTWKRATFACNIHRVAQVATLTSNLTESDVSGMISASLAFDTAGTLHKLRSILREIFQQDLCIYYASPPNAEHRHAVYDVFLPVSSHDPQTKGMPRKHHLLRSIQRSILDATLNGDIEGHEIQHFCTLGCCHSVEDTMAKFAKYCVWSLLPHKLPRFPRTRWSNREASVCWSGLLACHHNLLLRVLERFARRPNLQPIDHTDNADLLEDLAPAVPLADVEPEAVDVPHAAPVDDANFDEPTQDQEDIGEPLLGKGLDWTELNKQYQLKSVAWVNSNPRPRLVLMQLIGELLQRVMHKCLFLSGRKWERRQLQLEAKGLPRSYRVLEAADSTWTDKFYIDVRMLLGSKSKGHWSWVIGR